MSALGIVDTIPAIGLPYMASAFGIFLLRQTFKSVPRELDEAARVEGAGRCSVLLKVYVPLAKPVYIAYGLVSVSYHWNNFLWPLIITNSVTTRPADRRTADFRLDRPGHRLVDHHRRNADDLGAATDRVPAVPAAVRAKFHARRNPLEAQRPRRRRFLAAFRAASRSAARVASSEASAVPGSVFCVGATVPAFARSSTNFA